MRLQTDWGPETSTCKGLLAQTRPFEIKAIWYRNIMDSATVRLHELNWRARERLLKQARLSNQKALPSYVHWEVNWIPMNMLIGSA
ncbi:MAG: hypothetical protein ACKER6_01115 [Candidatus Hodgkinia cicadicola]